MPLLPTPHPASPPFLLSIPIPIAIAINATLVRLLLLLLFITSTTTISVLALDDAVLLHNFRRSIAQDPNRAFASWSLSSPARPCDWLGVECDLTVLKTGVPVVRRVTLTNKNIVGVLWPDLGQLKFLRSLNLSKNRFQGQVPPYVANAIVLESLDLSYNAFSGVLPSLEKLTHLKVLVLSNNQFEGDFPGAICDGPALRTIDMSNNAMKGVISPDISRCSNLEVLKLSDNALHGDVPRSLGELTRLRVLDLSHNQLTGRLPEAIGSMTYLTQLKLSFNYFTGFITPSISAAKFMVQLDLSNNQIGKNIPESLGSLTFLEQMSLSKNKLQGAIPQSIGKLTSLVSFLDLSHNMLTGNIPSTIGNLGRIQKIDLSDNRLSGSLPEISQGLFALRSFDLSVNRLSGSIPPSIQMFLNIQYLNMSNNALTGSIPVEIGNLITLSTFDLSKNSLIGAIPDTFGGLSNLRYFSGTYNKFTGTLPMTLQNLTYIEVFDMSHNNLSGLLIDIPIFQRFKKSGYLTNNRGLCGQVVNVTCYTPPNALKDFKKKAYKFLKSNEDKLKYIPFLLVSGVGVIILMCMVFCFCLKIFRPKLFAESAESWDVKYSCLLRCCGKRQRLSYKDLRFATENFCTRALIGSGTRYKIYLAEFSRHRHLVIKVLNRELFWLTRPYFLRECRILSKIHHTNVMCLLDWCYRRGFLAVVYKYMERGSLHDNLFGKMQMAALSWEERLGIATDVAVGLAFLHRRAKKKRVVYCQLCPNNVLLDEKCRAKIGGLQVVRKSDASVLPEGVLNKAPSRKLNPDDYTSYLAPECISEGESLSKEGEVYSYGLIILELITRKRFGPGALSLDSMTLHAKIRAFFPHDVMQFVDAGIFQTSSDPSNQVLALIEIGLLCTEVDPSERPNMQTVVSMLRKIKNGETELNHLKPQGNVQNVGTSDTWHALQPFLYQGFQQVIDGR